MPTPLWHCCFVGCLAGWAVVCAPIAAVAQTSTVNRPFLGVVHKQLETTVPRLLKMHLIEIDLDVTGVGFAVTPSNGPAAGETVGQTTRQFASAFGTQVAVNGGFSAWVSGSNYAVEGLAASQGGVYSEFQEFRTFALNISQDNVATIVRSVTGSGTDRSPAVPLYNTLPGEARLLRNGMIVQYENESLHPRTAVGLSADQRRLFIITVDGRNPGHSLGVTRPELADFLRMFGAHDAINLDGGGSSTLVFSDPQPRLINVPVGVNNTPGSQRTVGSNFGVFAPAVPTPAHVSIGVDLGTKTQGQAGHPQLVTALSLTKSGPGTLVLDVNNVFAGTTLVSQGQLRIAKPNALEASEIIIEPDATLAIDPATTLKSPRVTLAGGTLSAETVFVNADDGIHRLAIEGGRITESAGLVIGKGGVVTFPNLSRVVSRVRSLTVNEAAGGGRVDLGAGELAIAAGGISAAEIRADLMAGRNGGDWAGLTGITSSVATSGTVRAVGYVLTPDGSARVSLAAPGDSDLNGQVDIFDLVAIDSSGTYGTGHQTVWSQGDFNYDDVTNVFDLVAIRTAAAYGRGNVLPQVAGSGELAATSVPEPASVLVLLSPWLLLAQALLRRRSPQLTRPNTAYIVASSGCLSSIQTRRSRVMPSQR